MSSKLVHRTKTDPVEFFTTHRGGVLHARDDSYVWVVVPDGMPEAEVGDRVPDDWGIVPVNDSPMGAMVPWDDGLDLDPDWDW